MAGRRVCVPGRWSSSSSTNDEKNECCGYPEERVCSVRSRVAGEVVLPAVYGGVQAQCTAEAGIFSSGEAEVGFGILGSVYRLTPDVFSPETESEAGNKNPFVHARYGSVYVHVALCMLSRQGRVPERLHSLQVRKGLWQPAGCGSRRQAVADYRLLVLIKEVFLPAGGIGGVRYWLREAVSHRLWSLRSLRCIGIQSIFVRVYVRMRWMPSVYWLKRQGTGCRKSTVVIRRYFSLEMASGSMGYWLL